VNKDFTLDIGCCTSHRFGRFVQNAKRPPEISISIRGDWLDLPWRTGPFSAILQIPEAHPILDQERVGYVVVAKMTKPLRNRMVAARYHEFAHVWEAAEFLYTAPLEGRASVCGSAQAGCSGAGGGPEASVHLQAVHYHRALVTTWR
jgi:hypothetical protein